MRDDEQTWVGDLLASEADRHEVDVRAFAQRVLAEVDAPPPNARPVAARRRRFLPALVAAAAVTAVVLSGTLLTGLTRADDRVRQPVAAQSTSRAASPEASTVRPSSSTGPGSTIGRPTATAPMPTRSQAPASAGGPAHGLATLPSTYTWGSAVTVLPPRTDTDGLVAFKDPTVVRYGGSWHVFVTTVRAGSLGLGYLRFTDWSQAASAPLHDLADSPVGPGYRATPQVFWFAPQRLWYLVYQTGQASYSTNPDIDDPDGWSAPRSFYGATPDLVQQSLSAGGGWVGMWVVCDDSSCSLFSSDGRGRLFRSSTPRAAFPGGMSPPVLAAQSPDGSTTFAAGRVYTMTGTGRYLLLAQAFGPDGRGYLRSWTSPTIDGRWSPLADSPTNPFVGAANVTAAREPWTSSIVHGELLRDGHDQTLGVSPCRLELLALGLDPRYRENSTFQVGLVRQQGPACT